MRYPGRYLNLMALVGILFLSCTTTRDQVFAPVDDLVQAGRFEDAARMVEEEKDSLYKKKDRLLFFLESGLLAFYHADYAKSIEQLNLAEQQIAASYAPSVSQESGAFLVGESVRIYPGEGYEDLYLHVFKSLAFLLLDDYEGAFVEVRKMDLKLRLLEERYQEELLQYNLSSGQSKDTDVFLYGSALPRLLSLLLYRSEADIDGIRIDREKLFAAMDLQPQLYPRQLPSGIGEIAQEGEQILTVFANVGLSPLKKALSFQGVFSSNGFFLSAADAELAPFFDTIGTLDAATSLQEGSFRIKVEVPYLVSRPSSIHQVQVLLNGEHIGDLFPLESIEKIALVDHERKLPLIIVKSFASSIAKGVSSTLGSQAAAELGGEGVAAW